MIIEKFSELDELTSYLKNTERELISKALKYSETPTKQNHKT